MNLFRSPYKFSSLSAFWTLIYLMGGFLIVYNGVQYPLATSSSLSLGWVFCYRHIYVSKNNQ